jgi:hypothetical protein
VITVCLACESPRKPEQLADGRCKDRDACEKRVNTLIQRRLHTRPLMSSKQQEEAYRAAPKLGDQGG